MSDKKGRIVILKQIAVETFEIVKGGFGFLTTKEAKRWLAKNGVEGSIYLTAKVGKKLEIKRRVSVITNEQKVK